MIPVVFGAALIVGLLSAIAKARAETSPAARAVLAAPPSASGAVQRIVASNDPRKMVAAAAAAKQAGDHKLATELTKHAKNAAVTHAKAYPSPWPDVPDVGWNRFVFGMRGKDPKAIGAGYTLGLFGFGMRRLADLGLATNPHKGEHAGKAVWLADWLPALEPGPDAFLKNADLQYRTFVKSNADYAKRIHAELPELLEATLDGKPVTLSGLLAIAHRAGWEGMQQWLSDAKVRAAHKQSTELFNRLNGAF